MDQGFADYFDGRQAAVRRVGYQVDIAARQLIIARPEAIEIAWAFGDLRAQRDQADPERLIVTSLTQPLARLVVEDADVIAALRREAPKLNKTPAVRGKRRVAAWAAGALASVALIVFGLVPLTADQLARILPPSGEEALGEATLEQIRSALAEDFSEIVRVCEAPDGSQAMAAMQARLGRDYDLAYDVKITILDHPMVNAFALPGGQVVFFRGMLDAATHPDQIAAVLAHEIGHVVARDPTRIALRSAGSLGVLGLLFGDFAGGAAVLFLVEQLIRADYTREAEAAADDFGIAMMRNSGADPAALADLFAIMREKYGDVQGISAHFVSHPSLGDRIEKARAAGRDMLQTTPILNDAEWSALKTVCDRR
jgi:Zn-dependent protease with chaperone function